MASWSLIDRIHVAIAALSILTTSYAAPVQIILPDVVTLRDGSAITLYSPLSPSFDIGIQTQTAYDPAVASIDQNMLIHALTLTDNLDADPEAADLLSTTRVPLMPYDHSKNLDVIAQLHDADFDNDDIGDERRTSSSPTSTGKWQKIDVEAESVTSSRPPETTSPSRGSLNTSHTKTSEIPIITEFDNSTPLESTTKSRISTTASTATDSGTISSSTSIKDDSLDDILSLMSEFSLATDTTAKATTSTATSSPKSSRPLLFGTPSSATTNSATSSAVSASSSIYPHRSSSSSSNILGESTSGATPTSTPPSRSSASSSTTKTRYSSTSLRSKTLSTTTLASSSTLGTESSAASPSPSSTTSHSWINPLFGMPTTTLTGQSSSADGSVSTTNWILPTSSVSTLSSTSTLSSDWLTSSSSASATLLSSSASTSPSPLTLSLDWQTTSTSVSATLLGSTGAMPSPTSTTRHGFADIFETASSATSTPSAATPRITSLSSTPTNSDTLFDSSFTSPTAQSTLAPLAWAISTPSQSLQLMGSLAMVYPFTTSIPLMINPLHPSDSSVIPLSVPTTALSAILTSPYSSSTAGTLPTQTGTSSTSSSSLFSGSLSATVSSSLDTASSVFAGWIHSPTPTSSPRFADSSSQPRSDQIVQISARITSPLTLQSDDVVELLVSRATSQSSVSLLSAISAILPTVTGSGTTSDVSLAPATHEFYVIEGTISAESDSQCTDLATPTLVLDKRGTVTANAQNYQLEVNSARSLLSLMREIATHTKNSSPARQSQISIIQSALRQRLGYTDEPFDDAGGYVAYPAPSQGYYGAPPPPLPVDPIVYTTTITRTVAEATTTDCTTTTTITTTGSLTATGTTTTTTARIIIPAAIPASTTTLLGSPTSTTTTTVVSIATIDRISATTTTATTISDHYVPTTVTATSDHITTTTVTDTIVSIVNIGHDVTTTATATVTSTVTDTSVSIINISHDVTSTIFETVISIVGIT